VLWGAARESAAVIRAANRLQIPFDGVVVDDGEGPDSLESLTVIRGTDARLALLNAEIVIRSPGVSRYRPEVEALRAKGVITTTATNLWFAEPHSHVIAVTGTKGKSTTSSLIAHLWRALGFSVCLAGNIGRPPIDYLGEDEPQHWVIEVSSFQASDLDASPDVGVLTSLSPEHLDWHGSDARYIEDKLNVFLQSKATKTVVNMCDPGARSVANRLPNVIASGAAPGVHVDGGWFAHGTEQLFPTSVLGLVGSHNLQLACAALTALEASGIDLVARRSELSSALGTFEALPHRLRLIAEHNGVSYVDDGLSTTPVATIAALEAFADRHVSLLVGGYDRGLSYVDLAGTIAERNAPTHVLALPDNGSRIAADIHNALARAPSSATRVEEVASLEEAVQIAVALTPVGGVVLLSPGAASFGRFQDYADRSAQFIASVARHTGSDGASA